MATKAQKARLSIFLILSSSVLLIFFVLLVGNRLLTRMDRYYVIYRDVSVTGLEPGSAVKLQGVQVGRVAGLAVKDAASILVEIEVERGTPIKTDTEGVLTMVGITGLKFVELVGGKPESENLPPESTILAGESLFDNISGSAEVLLAKLEQIMNNLNAMTSPETTEMLKASLTSIAHVSSELDTLFKDNRTTITSTLTDLEVVMNNLKTSTEKIDSTMTALNDIMQSRDIQNTLANVRDFTDHTNAILDSLGLVKLGADLEELLGNANKMVINYDMIGIKARDDILKSLSNLEETIDNLREATDVIRENPSVLIRGRRTTGDRIE